VALSRVQNDRRFCCVGEESILRRCSRLPASASSSLHPSCDPPRSGKRFTCARVHTAAQRLQAGLPQEAMHHHLRHKSDSNKRSRPFLPSVHRNCSHNSVSPVPLREASRRHGFPAGRRAPTPSDLAGTEFHDPKPSSFRLCATWRQ
jgi:hypothetical protein